ncbi:hypothetical protein [Oceanirhabdus sp. W0125-5]|uniref:hypothetical protein n=1 Tax=Oceanirhabdus sp. W0125-5 TaxID=2999116 RepID=UPI0022F33546|nr:hypothetical protein [Oceanirhabdus sp. W0125-5]WBW97072.1 hypothetical protein OW730_25780 [Oceanirhabdus sp. W0125-5]
MLIPMLISPENAGDLKQVGEMLQSGNSSIFLVIIFAAAVILSSMNGISSTAISREGKNLYVIKYLPVSFKTQLMAKVLSAVVMGSLMTIIILIASAILIKPSIYMLVASGILCILGVLFTSFTGILLDLNFPKLNWDSEQKVVKQNITVMISMLVCVCVGVLTAYMTIKINPSERNAFLSIFAIYLVIDFILYYVVSTVGVKLIKKMKL